MIASPAFYRAPRFVYPIATLPSNFQWIRRFSVLFFCMVCPKNVIFHSALGPYSFSTLNQTQSCPTPSCLSSFPSMTPSVISRLLESNHTLVTAHDSQRYVGRGPKEPNIEPQAHTVALPYGYHVLPCSPSHCQRFPHFLPATAVNVHKGSRIDTLSYSLVPL